MSNLREEKFILSVERDLSEALPRARLDRAAECRGADGARQVGRRDHLNLIKYEEGGQQGEEKHDGIEQLGRTWAGLTKKADTRISLGQSRSSVPSVSKESRPYGPLNNVPQAALVLGKFHQLTVAES